MSKLSEALRSAAKKIQDNPKRYSWVDVNRCNCGFLVRAATKVTVVNLQKAIDKSDIGACWKEMIPELNAPSEKVCSVSKKPLWQLVNELKEMGMKNKDFGELENLSNLDIRKRAGLTSHEEDDWSRPKDYDQWKSVVAYMNAWADMIDEKEKAEALIKEISEFSVQTVAKKTSKIQPTKKISRKKKQYVKAI